jgi:hypothetical protein
MTFKVGQAVHVNKTGSRGGLGILRWEFDGKLIAIIDGIYKVETAAANDPNDRVTINCTKAQLTHRDTIIYSNPSA